MFRITADDPVIVIRFPRFDKGSSFALQILCPPILGWQQGEVSYLQHPTGSQKSVKCFWKKPPIRGEALSLGASGKLEHIMLFHIRMQLQFCPNFATTRHYAWHSWLRCPTNITPVLQIKTYCKNQLFDHPPPNISTIHLIIIQLASMMGDIANIVILQYDAQYRLVCYPMCIQIYGFIA